MADGCFLPAPWATLRAESRRILTGLGLEPSLAALGQALATLAPEPLQERVFWLCVGLLVDQSQGHTRVDLNAPDWPLPLRPFLEDLPALLAEPGMATLVGPPGSPRPFQWDGRWLSSQRLAAAESALARRARALASERRPVGVADPDVLQAPTDLNAEQRAAVSLALERPLALVTGGPGTGKTSIVVAILRALLRAHPYQPLDRILLTAPTGKAAQRMGEAIRKALHRLPADEALHPMDRALRQSGPDPRTLHRALGWHPGLGRFRHDGDVPLPADVVVVDEGSMVGLELMEALMAALAPGTRLILLGDADQLPSVDAGAAFRHLVEGLPDAVVRLRQSYRMDPRDEAGRHIYIQALRVNDPSRRAELWEGDGLRRAEGPAGLDPLTGVTLVEPPAPRTAWMARFLDHWMASRVRGGLSPAAWLDRVLRPLHHGPDGWSPESETRALDLLGHFDGFRILCALNEGAEFAGVDPVNRHFHARALEAAAGHLEGTPRFLAGEPVMVRANDARRGLFNGDQGVVLPVSLEGRPPRLEALFPRGGSVVAFPLGAIQEGLVHSYAMTIHKSQGSEFNHLAVLLPPADHPALTREILYTALTRAKQQVLILGSASVLDAACRRSLPRRSGLAQRLLNPGEPD